MTEKVKEGKYKKLIEQAEILGILLCIVLLIYFVYTFMISFHNLDLIHNMYTIAGTLNDFGIYDANGSQIIIPPDEIKDMGSDFVTRPLENFYVSSNNKLIECFILGLLDCLILGILLNRRLK